MKLVDLSGKKFGRLLVIGLYNSDSKYKMWNCVCDCGNYKIVRGTHLTRSLIRSCGCLAKEISRENGIKRGRHLETHTRLWGIWSAMNSRCSDLNNKYYGGRGIGVCEDWAASYECFRDWALINGYSDLLTIDRINNMDGYNPYNCRFTDRITQQNNRRPCNYITYNELKLTVTEWSRVIGVSRSIIYKSIFNKKSIGWVINEYKKPVITTISFRGDTLALKEWSIKLGININTLKSRYQKGFSVDRILSTTDLR
jgi:hypothetical protein